MDLSICSFIHLTEGRNLGLTQVHNEERINKFLSYFYLHLTLADMKAGKKINPELIIIIIFLNTSSCADTNIKQL